MARVRRALAAQALLAAVACTAGAQEASPAETGADAFARRDFEAAAELWRREAAVGSPEAKLGLGLISDLGLGAPRDPDRALRWYLEAAEGGLAEAQFNVAVMLDGGAGAERDASMAAMWYARAAAREHRRAQYNLGVLYETGEGVVRNLDLARHWLGRAATELEAARERLTALDRPPPETRALSAPEAVVGALVGEGAEARAELVWTAPPGPAGARFLVEIARLPSGGKAAGEVVVSLETDASALAADLSAAGGGHAWRVTRIDARPSDGGLPRYAASPWRLLGVRDDGASAPKGRVAIRIGRDDASAASLADEIAVSLEDGGLWVEIVRVNEPPEETAVRYAFAEDRELAAGIADFLPVLGRDDAVARADPAAAPGEVVVRLAGGPEGEG